MLSLFFQRIDGEIIGINGRSQICKASIWVYHRSVGSKVCAERTIRFVSRACIKPRPFIPIDLRVVEGEAANSTLLLKRLHFRYMEYAQHAVPSPELNWRYAVSIKVCAAVLSFWQVFSEIRMLWSLLVVR